ncbi:hypothetical protein FACS1894191_0460 [Clostridia bacterium]|nr:hypothetical protein FACS1894191_0460 [Clostridia bacterium]
MADLAEAVDSAFAVGQKRGTAFLGRGDFSGAGSHDDLKWELRRLARECVSGFGLVVAGVNCLNLINDAFGAKEGERMLREACALLEGVFGGESGIYRSGEDEFTVIAYNRGREELDRQCARVTAECVQYAEDDLLLSVSCGMAYCEGGKAAVRELYDIAEAEMEARRLSEIRSMHSQLIVSLKETLRARNVENASHMRRMENMAVVMARKLDFTESEFDRLALLASMHDIGMAVVPEDVLKKPGKLSREEWNIMRSHSEMGWRIAVSSQELSGIAEEIHCHHERWDGKGYPLGLSGGDIPLLSRVISVVDAYDVMTHTRVYRDSISHQLAVDELNRCAGDQFDPRIVALFSNIFGALTQEKMLAFIYSDSEENLESFRNYRGRI